MGVLQTPDLFFLPEEMRTGADGSALVRFLEQLRTVARGFVHQDVTVLGAKDATPVQRAHNALQRRDLGFAVRYCFLIQYEGLQ